MVRVVVGRLGRPHGIRGEVTVEIRTDEPELRFAPGSLVFVENQTKSFEVEASRFHSGMLLLKLRGVETRNDAETMRGTIVESEVADTALPMEEGEFYDRQLVGMEVVQSSEVIGRIADVLHLPSQDVLSIELLDGREMLLPFTVAFVPTVDVGNKRIEIAPPEGLMDDADAH